MYRIEDWIPEAEGPLWQPQESFREIPWVRRTRGGTVWQWEPGAVPADAALGARLSPHCRST